MDESLSTDFLMLNGLPGSGNMLCINAIQKINGLKYLETPQWFTTPAFPTELTVAAQHFSVDLDACLQVTFPGKSASDVQLTHPYRALHSFTHDGFWYGLKLKNYDVFCAKLWSGHQVPDAAYRQQVSVLQPKYKFICVRNPFDTLVSCVRKMAQGNNDYVRLLLSDDLFFVSMIEVINSYFNHYEAMADFQVVAYEDFISNPQNTLKSTANYLDWNLSDSGAKNIWEYLDGREFQPNNFYGGGAGKWKKYLSKSQVELFVKLFTTKSFYSDYFASDSIFEGLIVHDPYNLADFERVADEIALEIADVMWFEHYGKDKAYKCRRSGIFEMISNQETLGYSTNPNFDVGRLDALQNLCRSTALEQLIS